MTRDASKLHGIAPLLWIHSSILIRVLDQDVSQWRKCRCTSCRVMAASWWHAPNAACSLFKDLAGRTLDIRHFELQRVSHRLRPHFGRAVARISPQEGLAVVVPWVLVAPWVVPPVAAGSRAPQSWQVPASLASLMEYPCALLGVGLDHSPWLSHALSVPAHAERRFSACSPAVCPLPRIVGP